MRLTEDDRALLRAVYRHRFLRAHDLYRLFESRSPDRLSRRLTLLFRAGYLDRPPSQIDRFRQGGSESLVYGLGSAGAAALREELGDAASADWKAKNRAFTRDNLDHTLAVADVLIGCELGCRSSGSTSYVPQEELVPQSAVARWAVPITWRGNAADVIIVPDGLFALRRGVRDASRQATFLLEVDRGTMTISPAERVERSEAFLYRSSVLRKFIAYAESYRRGLHKALGLRAPRLLTITKNGIRLATMRSAARRVLDEFGLPHGLFLFGVFGPAAMNVLVDAGGTSTDLLDDPR